MSGLNRHPAKVLYSEMSTVGSNPTLSARFAHVTELAYVLVSETRFCGFDSRCGHQVLLDMSMHGVSARLLTENELGSIPRCPASFKVTPLS